MKYPHDLLFTQLAKWIECIIGYYENTTWILRKKNAKVSNCLESHWFFHALNKWNTIYTVSYTISKTIVL